MLSIAVLMAALLLTAVSPIWFAAVVAKLQTPTLEGVPARASTKPLAAALYAGCDPLVDPEVSITRATFRPHRSGNTGLLRRANSETLRAWLPDAVKVLR